MTLFTGAIAAKIFNDFKREINIENLDFEVIEVKNQFFGETINVAGLVVGYDILKSIQDKYFEHIVIPSVMLRSGTDEFLDGITIADIKKEAKKQNPNVEMHIIKDCYNFNEIFTILNN